MPPLIRAVLSPDKGTCFCFANGRVNQNVEPSPCLLAMPMDPSIKSTSYRQMASPRPVPPNCRVVEVSACVKD